MTASDPTISKATAIAHPNIALIKYWGKADLARNLPAVGSISITLDELSTTTQVEVLRKGEQDAFLLNGDDEPAMARRSFAFLDRIYGTDRPPLHINSRNDFPTAAGLASSASGFAALVTAANAALSGGFDRHALASQAGAGSGSAARSMFGGFVRLDKADKEHDDIRVAELLAPEAFPLEVLVAITSESRKSVGSTEAMQQSKMTSPYYAAWVETHAEDMAKAEAAIHAKDFNALAAVSEHSCLKMHAVMQASSPALIYWNGATVDCMRRITELRAEGYGVFFTIDAGPQTKAVCLPADADAVARELACMDGVKRVLRTALGHGARLSVKQGSE